MFTEVHQLALEVLAAPRIVQFLSSINQQTLKIPRKALFDQKSGPDKKIHFRKCKKSVSITHNPYQGFGNAKSTIFIKPKLHSSIYPGFPIPYVSYSFGADSIFYRKSCAMSFHLDLYFLYA